MCKTSVDNLNKYKKSINYILFSTSKSLEAAVDKMLSILPV